MDINMVAQLLSMLPGGNQGSNIAAQKNTQHQNASVFAMQNGLGEQVNVNNSQKSEIFNDMLKNMSAQNPLLGLLGTMQGAKGDLSSLLPLITSLMNGAKTQKNENMHGENQCKKDEIYTKNQTENVTNNTNGDNIDKPQDNSATANDFADTNKKCTKEKTQRDLLSPVAFGGYKVLCALYSLIKSKQHPCR